MRARLALYVAAVCLCCVTILSAQDAVKADPKHYSVVSENDQVRILKVHYGPHREVRDAQPSQHGSCVPDRCQGDVHFPRRKKAGLRGEGGRCTIQHGRTDLPENTGDKDMEVIVTELKGKTAHAAKPAKAVRKGAEEVNPEST